MRKIITLLITTFLLAVALSGCNNTVSGVGQDMQDNGEAIQKSAQ